MQTVKFGKKILRRECDDTDANTASVEYANAMAQDGRKVLYVVGFRADRPQELNTEIGFMIWAEGQVAESPTSLIVFNLDQSDPPEAMLQSCLKYRDKKVSTSVFTDSSSTAIGHFLDREISRNN